MKKKRVFVLIAMVAYVFKFCFYIDQNIKSNQINLKDSTPVDKGEGTIGQGHLISLASNEITPLVA